MRRSRNRDDRDTYADAAKAMRWAMSRFDATRSEAKWSAADTDVFHTVLRHIGTYSRLWDAVSVKELSRLSGRHERTCARSMKKLDEHAVIDWVRGDGRDWSEVYLPTSEGRRHVAAPRTAKVVAEDYHRETAPANRPPQRRRHATGPGAVTCGRPNREDTSFQLDTSPEKQAASHPTCGLPVEREVATEQSNPGTNGAEELTGLVDLVTGALGDVEPERRRRYERDGHVYVEPGFYDDDDPNAPHNRVEEEDA